jgi:hypothetical protein
MTHPEFARGLPGALTLRAGQTVTFPLRGAMGAGNTWTATSSDADIVGADVDVGPPPTPTGPHPASGTAGEVLVVRALRPGSAVVTARLARSWAPDPPVAEHQLTVTVPE